MPTKKICPLMSTVENQVDCLGKKCGLFERNFDMCSIAVIAEQLVENSRGE